MFFSLGTRVCQKPYLFCKNGLLWEYEDANNRFDGVFIMKRNQTGFFSAFLIAALCLSLIAFLPGASGVLPYAAEDTDSKEAGEKNENEDNSEEEVKLAFTKKKEKMRAGKKATFKVNLSDATFSSSKTKIATVSKKGVVKALRAGKTKISAVSGKQKVSAILTVKGKKVIGIDAGHQSRADLSTEPNGPGSSVKKIKVSGGTRGTTTGIYEYQLTLAIAKKMKAKLIDRGYEVVMTRTKHDVKISNKERALKLNKDCDIAVRLHADGASGTAAHGASALYPGTTNPYVSKLSAPSKKLSEKVLAAYCKNTGISSRGLYVRNDLTGTNWSTIPVTLIEMGFMTNPSDDRYMASETGREKMAEGICSGIDDYFGF